MFLGIVKIALKGCKSYYGSFVSILVVFEAETGFSVLFVLKIFNYVALQSSSGDLFSLYKIIFF